MTNAEAGALRPATTADGDQLLRLWGSLFDDDPVHPDSPWIGNARDWFERSVDDRLGFCFPVIDVDGLLVATAIGALELGVPNPYCPRGRTARLANVVTAVGHRGQGHGTRLVLDVIDWARSVEADRVDLSATADGQRLYDRLGFVPTSAPRMKLVL